MTDDGDHHGGDGDGRSGDDASDGTGGPGGDGPTFDVEAVFDPEDYCYFYADRVAPERSEREAEFVAEALDLAAGDRVLDVPCGHGRIANPLAARGHDVTGLDATAGFLDRAREAAGERGIADRVEYVEGDMRSLPWGADAFDAAYNVFTSFGYFDEAGNRRVLDELARVLRPGGRLLVDVVNHDGTVAEFQPVRVTRREGDLLVDESEFDPRTGRITTERTTVRDGEVSEMTFSVRSYTYPELEARLADAGFALRADYGSLEGDDYDLAAPRLVVVAELEA